MKSGSIVSDRHSEKFLAYIAQELDMALALGGEELTYTAQMLSGL